MEKESDERKKIWIEEATKIDHKFLVSDLDNSNFEENLPPIEGIKVEVIAKQRK